MPDELPLSRRLQGDGLERERPAIAWLPPALALFLSLYAIPIAAAVSFVYPTAAPAPATAVGVGVVALLGALTVIWPHLVPNSGGEEKEGRRTWVLPLIGWICTVIGAVALTWEAGFPTSAEQMAQIARIPRLWVHLALFAYAYQQAYRISVLAADELGAWERWRQYGRRVVQLPPRRCAAAFRDTYAASIVALCLVFIGFDLVGFRIAERWGEMSLLSASGAAVVGWAIAIGLEHMELHISWQMRNVDRLPAPWARLRIGQGVWLVLGAALLAFAAPRVSRLIDVRAIRLPDPRGRELPLPELPPRPFPEFTGELPPDLPGPLLDGWQPFLEWVVRIALAVLLAVGMALVAAFVRRLLHALPREATGFVQAFAALWREGYRVLREWWRRWRLRARPSHSADSGGLRLDPSAPPGRRALFLHRQHSRDPVRRVYRRLLLRASRVGWARRRGETPREFAARLRSLLEYEGTEALYELTGLYERTRYGPALSDEEARAFARRARELWRTVSRSWPMSRPSGHR